MQRHLVVFVFGILLVLAPGQVSGQQPPALWFDLEPGPYVPAFSVEYLIDGARAWCSDDDAGCALPGRPIRVFIWSPATSATGTTLSIGDLLAVDPDEPYLQSYDDIVDDRAEDTFGRQFFGEDREQLAEQLRREPTWSFSDATAAPGPFPLVLHSLGRNDFQLESTVLWEYLASHGFVVAVVPQIGRAPETSRLDFSAEDMRAQAEDVAFVAARMREKSYVDGDQYGIIGYSSGAVAAFLAADQDPDVAAIVSLDGSITTDDGRALLEPLGWADNTVRLSLLNIYRADKGSLDLWVVDEARGIERYDVAAGEAIHFDFQNWPLYNARWEVEESRSAEVRSPERARDLFLASVELTRDFLGGVLTGDLDAIRRVRQGPYPTGFDGDGAQIDYRPSD